VVVRATAVVLVLFVAACGDDGPSREERVAAVCDAWQEALDAPTAGQEETTVRFDVVAAVALESDTHMGLLGMSLTDALHPFDRDAFTEAAAGFEQECG
jgi:hypothetical protein